MIEASDGKYARLEQQLQVNLRLSSALLSLVSSARTGNGAPVRLLGWSGPAGTRLRPSRPGTLAT